MKHFLFKLFKQKHNNNVHFQNINIIFWPNLVLTIFKTRSLYYLWPILNSQNTSLLPNFTQNPSNLTKKRAKFADFSMHFTKIHRMWFIASTRSQFSSKTEHFAATFQRDERTKWQRTALCQEEEWGILQYNEMFGCVAKKFPDHWC